MQKILLGVVFIVILFFSCRREKINDSPDLELSFSTDTVFFDTIFSTLGSSTRRFKIYNPNNDPVNVSSIELGGGNSSFYRININGSSGTSFESVEIGAKDSIWGFAEVTVDPNASTTPYIVSDSIEFLTNGNLQKVRLVAFGQNAVFHKPSEGNGSFLIDCDDVWTNDLPHVVFGIGVIDSTCQLTIEAGAKVHFSSNGALLAYSGASLKVQGTLDEPVEFLGSRLESWFENEPGQWRGIYLWPLSYDNEFNHAIIRNAQIGIQCDTTNDALSSNPTLAINNSQIYNCSTYGILGRGTYIKANNVVIGNCGEGSFGATIGGKYVMNHCTFGNYWSHFTKNRENDAVQITNWFKASDGRIIPRDINETVFNNCIIYGSRNNELSLSKVDNAAFDIAFNNCIIRGDGDLDMTQSFFVNCLKNENPLFVDPSENDYQIQENSSAINQGDENLNLPFPILDLDLLGNDRTVDEAPDIGAIELITE